MGAKAGTGSIPSCPVLLPRYPRVMVEEGLRAVRQWLEASSQLEEASIYSRWEVEEDWCVSVLRSYQAEHGPDFPWSVGKEGRAGAVEGRAARGPAAQTDRS